MNAVCKFSRFLQGPAGRKLSRPYTFDFMQCRAMTKLSKPVSFS